MFIRDVYVTTLKFQMQAINVSPKYGPLKKGPTTFVQVCNFEIIKCFGAHKPNKVLHPLCYMNCLLFFCWRWCKISHSIMLYNAICMCMFLMFHIALKLFEFEVALLFCFAFISAPEHPFITCVNPFLLMNKVVFRWNSTAQEVSVSSGHGLVPRKA